MKKIVLVCGLIAGFIVSIVMVISMAILHHTGKYEGSMLLGYATMLVAFSLVFVGIKNYRDKYNNGMISFGKAFRIGLYISLIASTMYVAAWALEYNLFIPDYMNRYVSHVLQQAKSGGASQAEMNKQVAQMEGYKEMYKNPLLFVLLTYLEILPVGLLVTLICALLLKRKMQSQPIAA